METYPQPLDLSLGCGLDPLNPPPWFPMVSFSCVPRIAPFEEDDIVDALSLQPALQKANAAREEMGKELETKKLLTAHQVTEEKPKNNWKNHTGRETKEKGRKGKRKEEQIEKSGGRKEQLAIEEREYPGLGWW
ncbi:hypothetical protein NDU88_010951 [Pleurodeles waltl]|uniref:Uncharacterized protein n=1 Tax=Pleurodeles waltl TaxID=8319 RepID=A0AAV7PXJ4_PLEWA|nr:hypothetical protein NDU88_010951 [Pleurodeles waltl]